MSKDNFKDEFEQSRQEIKSHNHDEPSSETHVDDLEQQTENNQQFPPRNASRRHRKREHGQSPVNDSDQVDKDTDSSEQETNEKAQKRPGTVGGFVNHQDEHTKAKNDQLIAKDEVKERSTQKFHQNDQSIEEHKEEHKEDQTHDQNHVVQTRDDQKSDIKDKAALTGAAALGGGAIAKHHHDKTTPHHESTEGVHSNQDNTPSNDKNAQHENNTDKEKAVSGAAVGAGASQTYQSSYTGTENSQPAHETHVSNGRSSGGRFKKLLPLLAAIILLGALAIFGGIYLVNHNQQGDHTSHVAQKQETKEHSKSDKEKEADKDKSTKNDDKAQSDNQDDNNNADNDNATDDSNTSNQNNNNAQDTTSQTQQQYNQNNQQYGQQNGQANNQQAQNNNGHTHTVTGNQNLYRIAIQYYGNGSPENVDKIRRANGIQGNNIRNGQQLIIP